MRVKRRLLCTAAVLAGFGASARGDASKKETWHKTLLDYAANYDTAQDSLKRKHERITKFCGHDMTVQFDWATFEMSEWVGHDMGAGYVSDELTAGRNCVSILDDLGSACEHDDARRTRIAKVKTITCVSIPPAKMPNDHGYSSVYKLNKNETNIDVWEVPFMMSGLPRASDWITEAFNEPAPAKEVKTHKQKAAGKTRRSHKAK